jgi:endopeptidase Clp ATP-binding regulatory subunit ClpX
MVVTNKRIPTPEELQEDLSEFLRKKYGDHVQLGVQVQAQPQSAPPGPDRREKRRSALDFHRNPKDVKDHLDRFVIGQEAAKRALSIAICDHYNYVRDCDNDPKLRDEDYTKQNIIMVGPTGVGKTYLVRTLAKLVGVPFVKADATKFSETGYVGGNVEDLVRDLVTQADGDIELAQYGIIYLDEADKIATPPNIIGRDVSGRGVQMNLLKLMEETEVDLRVPWDPASQMQAALEFQQKGRVEKHTVNTRHILFIVSGAFTALADIVRKRLGKATMGFGGNVERHDDVDYLAQARSEDFVKFGYEPEFIGRLPVHVYCHDLTIDHLYEILARSEGSVIRQYTRAFQGYGVDVIFEDDGLRAIAEQAQSERTGARGLMTVCERTLRDFKFELPSSKVRMLVVNRELIENPGRVLERLLSDEEFRLWSVARHAVQRYTETFRDQTGIELRFDESAVDGLYRKALDAEEDIFDLVRALFRDYEHGLSLIRRNSGQTQFTISGEVVQDPDTALSEWIRQSYGKPAR